MSRRKNRSEFDKEVLKPFSKLDLAVIKVVFDLVLPASPRLGQILENMSEENRRIYLRVLWVYYKLKKMLERSRSLTPEEKADRAALQQELERHLGETSGSVRQFARPRSEARGLKDTSLRVLLQRGRKPDEKGH
jgi:hypothetical protein